MSRPSAKSERPISEQDAPPLDRHQIAALLTDDCKNRTDVIEVLQTVKSTSAYLLEQDIELGRSRLCVTEAQQSGRGRRGRSWQSSPHRNIMMSVSWGFSHWPETITGLGLAVSLIVAERLNQNYSIRTMIKWPNDLMLDDKKLAGILVDVSGQPAGACKVVLGLGLNVDQTDWSQNSEHSPDYAWQDLRGAGVEINRNVLIAELYGDLVKMLEEFEKTGFAPLAERWNSLSNYRDRQITVSGDNLNTSGIMRGVTEQGALKIIDKFGQEQQISDSNVSVRLQQ